MRRSILRVALPVALSACGACATATRATISSPAALANLSDSVFFRADSFLVRLETTKGVIDLMVRRDWAPQGAPRVGQAVYAGYYDGARFFRALRGFVVQWGIAADSAATATWSSRSIPDDTVRQSNRRGTVSFAAGGPNTRTVQLFFNLRDNARLDWLGFAPIGEVIAGMDVVDALHTDYGEGAPAGNGPTQTRLRSEGESYLAKEFPLLDQIVSASVVRVWLDGDSPPAPP